MSGVSNYSSPNARYDSFSSNRSNSLNTNTLLTNNNFRNDYYMPSNSNELSKSLEELELEKQQELLKIQELKRNKNYELQMKNMNSSQVVYYS